MSASDPDNYFVVRPYPGTTVSDMEDYVKPLVRRSPENVILHVGTNDLRSCPPRNIADSILNLVTQVKQDSPTTSVGVSELIIRTDSDALARKARQVNSILRDYCEHNKIVFMKNSNITTEHLNHKGLHLNRQGSVALQENFRKFVNTTSHWPALPCEVAVALDNETSHSNNASVQRLNSQSNSFLFVPSKRGFKIACLNTRSLSAHIDELRILLADSPIDVLAINEIWLDSTKSDNDVYISGYQIIRRDRVDGQFDDGESENVEYWLLGDLNCNLGAPILDHKSKTLSGIADLYNPEQLIEEPNSHHRIYFYYHRFNFR